MRYFLKKTKLKKGEYLQIYISEYRRGIGARNRCFESIGYVPELRDKGIKDVYSRIYFSIVTNRNSA